MTQTDAPYILTLALEAQSPMIHFQAREPGATLRASEVKPKLDRFVLERLERKTGLSRDALRKDEKYKEFFLPANGGKNSYALNYKLRIECRAPSTVVVINNDRSLTKDNNAYRTLPKYPIYYGNSGVKEPKKQRLGVISAPTVVIHCFVPGLRAFLEDNLEDFFLITNFGTMQSKGFGSFAPVPWQLDEERVAALLKEKTGLPVCFVMQVRTKRDKTDFSEHFKRIESFYHLMKSGYNNAHIDFKTKKPQTYKATGEPILPEYERSFLFQYMHRLKPTTIGNEKAWLKQTGLAPDEYRNIPRPTRFPPNTNPRYVRAFLGTAGSVMYSKWRPQDSPVSISSDTLPRVPSPLFFKILGNRVFIAAYPIPDELYGESFTFKSFDVEKVLPAPERKLFAGGEFDMADFLRQYAAHYNNLIRSRKLPLYLNDAPEVREL